MPGQINELLVTVLAREADAHVEQRAENLSLLRLGQVHVERQNHLRQLDELLEQLQLLVDGSQSVRRLLLGLDVFFVDLVLIRIQLVGDNLLVSLDGIGGAFLRLVGLALLQFFG